MSTFLIEIPLSPAILGLSGFLKCYRKIGFSGQKIEIKEIKTLFQNIHLTRHQCVRLLTYLSTRSSLLPLLFRLLNAEHLSNIFHRKIHFFFPQSCIGKSSQYTFLVAKLNFYLSWYTCNQYREEIYELLLAVML